MKTLVIYDIHEDKKREKLRAHLLNYGLNRVQYSGLFGELNTHDRLVLTKEVGQYISSEDDSIYIVPLCDRCTKLCNIVSQKGVGMVTESKVDYVP
jgi:CRISPR-associated protein Cas2